MLQLINSLLIDSCFIQSINICSIFWDDWWLRFRYNILLFINLAIFIFIILLLHLDTTSFSNCWRLYSVIIFWNFFEGWWLWIAKSNILILLMIYFIIDFVSNLSWLSSLLDIIFYFLLTWFLFGNWSSILNLFVFVLHFSNFDIN